jgi:predicted phosphodiesterase
MRVAALYDIHGNPPALDAVLQDVRRAQVDQIVVGGDVVPGPMSRETLAYLLDLEIPVQFIQGNCEVAVLAEMGATEPDWYRTIPADAREVVRWQAQQIPDYQRLFGSWPKTLRVDIDGLGEALFCHATPRDENEVFTRVTAEDRLLPVFDGLGVPLVVCGHTHMQFDRRVGRTRVINAGSVGMPFGPPGAFWLLLGPEVELKRTSYDLVQAAERIRATNYPQAQDFANGILQPRSEEETIELFSKAELR